MARLELRRRSDGVLVTSAELSLAEGEHFDRVLSGELEDDVLVPEGQNWLVGPEVKVSGNLRTVGGRISLRGGGS